MMLAPEPASSKSLSRRHSLAPFAQQSLLSAPEIDSVSSATGQFPLPVLNRRHSLSLMRKPLRSSPLAGPALSSVDDDTPATRPVRTFSTPDLRLLGRSESPLPPPPPRASKGLSKRASLLQLVKRPLALKSPPPPIPLPPPPSNAPATSKNGTSIIHTPLSPPPLSPRHRERARSRSSMTASMSVTDLSTSFPLPPPSFPRARTAPSSNRRSSTLPLPQANAAPVYGTAYLDSEAHRRNDSGESWLTSLPFGDTPRFSRLSLAAPNVVMPVSARETRRQSIRGKGGKRVSLVYASPVTPRSSSLVHTNVPYAASTPSLLSRSRSRSLSSEGPATPSAASSILDVALAEDDEDEGVDISLVSPRDFDVASQDASSENAHGHIVHKPTLPPTHSTWSLSIGRRGHQRSHAKGTSFLSFGSGDSTSTSVFSPMQSPLHSPAHSPAPSYSPGRFGAGTPTLHAELTPYDAALAPYTPSEFESVQKGTGKLPKAAGTMRRILRSLSGVTRRGT